VIGKFAEIFFAEEMLEVEFCYTTDKEEAFTDMDFIFCQMRTGGPGDFAYGMSSIRDMIEMVNDVRDRSPEAWILNYTNPAAIVELALNEIFPNDKKILNICDQPVNLLHSYARILDYDVDKMKPLYFGLNHFGWRV